MAAGDFAEMTTTGIRTSPKRLLSTALLTVVGMVPRRAREWILKKRYQLPVLKSLTSIVASALRNDEFVVREGVGKGLRIDVGSSAAAYVLGIFKPDLQKFMELNLKQGSVFYDVGANVGFFSLLAARLAGSEGRVISFEPIDENVSKLSENARRNQFGNVRIFPIALGAVNGERTFQLSESPTWGKFKGVAQELPDRYVTDTTVRVRRLDDLLSAEKLTPPDFIKIDVEGAELEVIEGARDTLLHYGPTLMIELHGTNEALVSILGALGYSLLPLSSSTPNVTEAHWNAMTLAFPSARAGKIVSQLRESFLA
jgi:FkbM family methyltransferase